MLFFFFFGCILWFWTLSYWYKDFSLNGDLKEDVYIEKPKGFIPKWDENWVCTSENYMGWKNLVLCEESFYHSWYSYTICGYILLIVIDIEMLVVVK